MSEMILIYSTKPPSIFLSLFLLSINFSLNFDAPLRTFSFAIFIKARSSFFKRSKSNVFSTRALFVPRFHHFGKLMIIDPDTRWRIALLARKFRASCPNRVWRPVVREQRSTSTLITWFSSQLYRHSLRNAIHSPLSPTINAWCNTIMRFDISRSVFCLRFLIRVRSFGISNGGRIYRG